MKNAAIGIGTIGFAVRDGVSANADSLPRAGAPSVLSEWFSASDAPPQGPSALAGAVSLLDETAHLRRNVSADEVHGWKIELHSMQPTPARAALLHLWMGEWELAANQEPDRAAWHFRRVRQLCPPRDQIHGLAAFNGAVARFFVGEYDAATADFARLLAPRTALFGYDRRRCALWLRHARACAGYHGRLSELNIPRPRRLDPLCGVGGLAVCLRALGMPHDEKHVRSVCRVTGMGSSFADLITAAHRLGLAARALSADEAGLKALPKPLIAYVEHDHFVTVTRADSRGVTYLCTDCGPWPGGTVELTWEQWRALEATAFLSVVRPGGTDDQLLTRVLQDAAARRIPQPSGPTKAPNQPLPGTQVAEQGAGLGAAAGPLSSAAAQLAGHVTAFLPFDTLSFLCGHKPDALRCLFASCPWDDLTVGGGGSCANDPVNLATGEEEYTPAPDITVYNPNGPDVVWSRIYNSLRGPDAQYQSDDFGIGWSHNYNIYVYDPNGIPGTPPPPSPGDPTIPPPAPAPHPGPMPPSPPPGTGNDPFPAPREHIHPWPYPRLGPIKKWFWSTQPDAAVDERWFDDPNAYTYPLIGDDPETVQPPFPWETPLPDPWANTEFSGMGTPGAIPPDGGGGGGVAFQNDTSSSWDETTGTWCQAPGGGGGFGFTPPPNRYLILPNGGRVAFYAPPVVSASYSCRLDKGIPFMIELCAHPTDPMGYYVITHADGTKWKTTTRLGDGKVYPLAEVQDSLGNSLAFQYASSTGATGMPLIQKIKDISTNTALLTIQRDGSGAIQSVSDAYGRSVYYNVGTYATTNPGAIPSYRELDRVTRIVPTGSASGTGGPMRYQYGYTNVPIMHENQEVPFLATITVPSPTGSGTSTTTLAYDRTYGPNWSTNSADAAGYVQQITDANGNQRIYQIVASNKTRVIARDAAGTILAQSLVQYDLNMNQTQITDELLGKVVWSAVYAAPYTPYVPSSVRDAWDRTTWLQWDRFGHLVAATLPGYTNYTVAYTWDYTRFRLGRLMTAATLGQIATFTYYEPSGLVKSVTAPSPAGTGTVTTAFTYDRLGNVLTVAEPGNDAIAVPITAFDYTNNGAVAARSGLPLRISDPLGRTTLLGYDARGNLTQITDPNGITSEAAYNIADQVQTTWFPWSGRPGWTVRARVESTYLYPGGPQTGATFFDEASYPRQSVTFAYGPEGEPTMVAGDTPEPALVAYDGLYRRKALTDGNNHTTNYAYGYRSNGNGGQEMFARMTYPGGAFEEAVFDEVGQMVRSRDARGLITTYDYLSGQGWLSAINYPASPGRGAYSTLFEYDGYGRRSRLRDVVMGSTNGAGGTNYGGVTDYAYVPGTPLPSAVQVTPMPGQPTKTLTYTYFPNGARRTLGTPEGTFLYGYNGSGELKTLTNPLGQMTQWEYFANGLLKKQTLGNGASTEYEYGSRGWLSRLVNKNGSGQIVSEFLALGYYDFDDAGRWKRFDANVPAYPAFSGQCAFTYDVKGRLTQEQSTVAGGYTNGFGLDAAGNVSPFKGASRTYNTLNQLTGGNKTTGGSLGGFTYDGSGNPTLYRGIEGAFDAANRLANFGDAPGQSGYGYSFSYNGDGVRIRKAPSSGLTYLHDVSEFLNDGTTPVVETGSGTFINTFGAAGLVSRTKRALPTPAPETTFYQFDPLGNVIHRLDENGNVTLSSHYSAHGSEAATDVIPTTDPFGYKGQFGYYTDRQIGLIFCTNRFYDPEVGRWINRDPIGDAGGINLYGYCSGDPVNGVDPLGLEGKKSPIIVGASPELQARIQTALTMIKSTKRGQELYSQIDDKNEPILRIIIKPGYRNCTGYMKPDGSRTIILDPRVMPVVKPLFFRNGKKSL